MKQNHMPAGSMTWVKTRSALTIIAIVALILAYIVISRAIDTGGWWEYLGGFILVTAAVQSIIKIFNKRK